MIEIKIPQPGESVTEVVLSRWFVSEGDIVAQDQEIGEIESEKATLPIISPCSGKVFLKIAEGTPSKVGSIACVIDETISFQNGEVQNTNFTNSLLNTSNNSVNDDISTKNIQNKNINIIQYVDNERIKITPLAKQIMKNNNLTVQDILKGLIRIKKSDVENIIALQKQPINNNTYSQYPEESEYRRVKRQPLSALRKKLSQRLVAVKNETAMLTTFNEIDMSEVIKIRNTYQKSFSEKHGVKLGFMSFFAMASAIALKKYPNVNSQIEGDEILHFDYVDIGIAVQTDKGLIVPIIRNAEKMGLAELEKEISRLAAKARSNKLSLSDIEGGTFTITNGGVFGSMLSTPILNPPQAAILGMHNIIERPVGVNGKIELRPMMYVALTYDHRIIDGRDSVSFLYKIKELIENPTLLLLDGDTVTQRLLDI